MNKKLSSLLLILFVLFPAITQTALAQTRIPGVKLGDYFTYTIDLNWNSSNSSATLPESLSAYNVTLWYRFWVSGVTGSNIAAYDLQHFRNGTEQSFSVIQDIASGDALSSNAFQNVVGANLNVGDLLHPAGGDGISINQTISEVYAGAEREINVVSLTYQQYNSTLNMHYAENSTMLYDKATGMLVKSDDQIAYTNPTESSELVWTLQDTNAWGARATNNPNISIFSLPYSAMIPFVITLAVVGTAVLVYFKKYYRKK
jgi:hypothetical protein